MDGMTTSLLITTFGALMCSVLLATFMLVYRATPATVNDEEWNLEPLPQTVIAKAQVVTKPKYQPKLTDCSYEVNVLPIPIPKPKAKLTLSLYTDAETENYFRNSAYAPTRQSWTPSLRSDTSDVVQYRTLDYSEVTSFSDSLKRRISLSTADEGTKSFMMGLASSYADHYEMKAKKSRTESLRSVSLLDK
ncbi:hypothetical protein BCR33DRAFT_736135 [Rhizoclosmatium globosum]|uniref:Uncharacterized protein n=1 Tax=Rhizoclosmatium globosum TaxID=329046 RepID=A0A1Y2CKA7_9FUNG|nr:hypothetical protein HDU79_008107 [Rhizoclosmatium sp. JEL0117]ORY47294.1 hypothetical protein BCR33DRAFT_736135 [Rhizoclosmatium globosum]|eukprot:ORY47294.1 hypothetical protein BCR33DRAFT_736135 [Rhizoclosmatium globosum]